MAESDAAQPEPIFFATPAEIRKWLRKNHEKQSVLWVGYHRKATARPSITWPESVDEALCVGWIDGIRKRWDGESSMGRLPPRKPRSTWSAINIARVAELTRQRRMQPAGLAAFARRSEERCEIYAYEQRANAKLDAEAERRLRANAKAWAFFEAQPPSHRKLMAWWIISAKRPETREKRLVRLIEESAAGRRL